MHWFRKLRLVCWTDTFRKTSGLYAAKNPEEAFLQQRFNVIRMGCREKGRNEEHVVKTDSRKCWIPLATAGGATYSPTDLPGLQWVLPTTGFPTHRGPYGFRSVSATKIACSLQRNVNFYHVDVKNRALKISKATSFFDISSCFPVEN